VKLLIEISARVGPGSGAFISWKTLMNVGTMNTIMPMTTTLATTPITAGYTMADLIFERSSISFSRNSAVRFKASGIKPPASPAAVMLT